MLRSRVTIGLSGVFAWLLAGPLPLLAGEGGSESASWTAVVPLGILATGVALLSHKPRWAQGLLLGLFPPALLVAAYLEQPRDLEAGLSGYAVSVAALGLALYIVGTLRALGRGAVLTPAVSTPLDGDGAARSEPRRRVAGTIWVALGAVGAFSVFAITPFLIDSGHLIEGFGEGAAEARLLMTAVGTCLGLGSLAFTVAPSLRARRDVESRLARRLMRYGIYPLALAVTVALWWFARR